MQPYDAVTFKPPAPVARVSVRRPGSTDAVDNIPMLIDTGSDVTLIPKAPALALGVAIDTDSGYELAGFDGTKSFAPAAQLDLLFLKRAFVGRFLLIDQPCGILGRNVLNHVALLFDGPNAIWSENIRPG